MSHRSAIARTASRSNEEASIDVSHLSAWIVEEIGLGITPPPDSPRLSSAHTAPVHEVSVVDEQGERHSIAVPSERPLRIVVDHRELVTLMTLGGQPELLVLGYLINQRLIREVGALRAIHVDWSTGIAAVETRSGLAWESAAGRYVIDACGLGTAFDATIATLKRQSRPSYPRLAERTLLNVLDAMHERDGIHRAAGSVHSAGLFLAGRLHVSVEDVSRHNGVDTITGWMALHGVDGEDAILFSTGRMSAEMIMKAAHNGITVMVSRNGTTAMGIELASKLGMLLITRAMRGRYLVSVGAERFRGGDSVEP